ncbi:MAG: sulfotransferase, partial [Candidatus Heimdallarchaeota archaeon]|nr:sulfotransferase [Candidatus Heimdallarchaeota archaeon]MCK5144863.1 sulfotransferase [Candidatus Heimdallarchaeota archaeon]
MTKSRFSIDRPQPFKFPVSMYYLARFFYNHPKFNLKLSNWESKLLRKKIENLKVDRPVYVTGLARAGSTVTVEMIGKHPDVAYHKYMHSVNPFIPHLVQQIAKVVPIFKKPVERVHKDGLMVNRDSPEAVEEPMWMRFFDTIHNDKVSNIFDEQTSNPEFEKTYDLILRKLMYNQKSTRYVAKNNYNVSRLKYLHKLYPDLKII